MDTFKTSALIAKLMRINTQVITTIREVKIIKERVEAAVKIFLNYEELEAWLEDPENLALLHVGMSIYFVDTDIPDLWYAGPDFGFLPMEGEKVDLSPFVLKEELPDRIHEEIAEEKGVANGVAYLDSHAQVHDSQLDRIEKIANRGRLYPTLDKIEVNGVIGDYIPSRFIQDIYEYKVNKG